MELAGRVALISGGGTGIGRAIGLALAGRGVDVAVNYSRSRDEAEATVAELRGLGVRALALQADVAVEAEVRALVAAVEAELGRLDILVCNAGTSRYAPLAELDAFEADEWDRIVAVNVKGAFFCARAAAPALRRAGGTILTVASNSGLIPAGSSLPYVTSKAMMIMLTKCLAKGLAPAVRVNGLAPGYVATRWLERVFESDEVRQRVIATAPTPPASPEQVAQAALALIENDAIIGHVLVIDGGEVLG